jgi:hypothetical protein
MTLRIGYDTEKYFVEQRRWWGGWSICAKYSQNDLPSEEVLRFWKERRGFFNTFEEAAVYAKKWRDRFAKRIEGSVYTILRA